MAKAIKVTVTLLALIGSASTPARALAADIDEQREIFLEVFADVERGNWDVVDALGAGKKRELRRYVLWPDLQAAWFRASLDSADPSEIEEFLDRYGTLRPARDLRYRYAIHLAKSGNFAAYLDIYQQYYQGMDIARLDCLALQAELSTGRPERISGRALALWTVAESQVEECDPVFDYLAENSLIGIADYMKRFDMAVEAREFDLARWLGRSIDEHHVEVAEQWLDAERNPENFARTRKQRENSETARKQLVYAIERLTYRDPAAAFELWTAISAGRGFSAEQEIRTSRHIALWYARDKLPGAYDQLVNLPDAAQNDEVLRWRARTSLRDRNWGHLIDDVSRMGQGERDNEEWRYWRAIALAELGLDEDAAAILAPLAGERSYYGFLAADELGLPYALATETFEPDESAISSLSTMPPMLRARELFLVGQDSRGRSEWDAAVRELSPDQKMQAAILAQRLGWHSRAIAAAASVGHFDDLALRYPLPFQDDFQRYAIEANIPLTWAYGVARSESLFMPDVRSRAGAIGLMQLMPSTGRAVAQEIQLDYSGLITLTDPRSNIHLGTSYLGQMAQRFGGNRVLATAAYNAGPHRVEAWLPPVGEVDARIWIENIPFNETRSYVRRVLEAETIFQWRMTGRFDRLSDQLRSIEAAVREQLALN